MMFYFGNMKSPYDSWSKTILNEKTRMIFVHSCIHYKCHLALWFSFILYFSQQKWIPIPKNKVSASLPLIDLRMEVGLLSNSTNWKKTLVWNKFLNKLIRISFLETQLSYLKAAAHYFIVQCIFTKNKQLGSPKNYRLDRKTNDTARFALTVNILKLRCQLLLSLNLTRGSVPEILHCFF